MSIITLFVLILTFSGVVIIAINYGAIEKILVKSSQKYIEQTIEHIKLKLDIYLQPLDEQLLFTGGLLSEGILNPSNHSQLDHYLYILLKDNPNIYGAYWGTPQGDFYGIDRESNNQLTLQYIIRSGSSTINTRYKLNAKGERIASYSSSIDYDPRNRPWYQSALLNQQAIWTNVYSFHLFEEGNMNLTPGITAAIPIFDRHHNLLGIWGVDLSIDRLDNFINQLKISNNAIVYIFNEQDRVISYSNPYIREQIRGQILTEKNIRQFHIPYPLENYLKEVKSGIVDYNLKGKTYFLAEQTLENKVGSTWKVGIIIPMTDISGPLKSIGWYSLLFTIICLFIAIIAVRYLSQRIAKPIVQLTKEAKAIAQLEVNKPIIVNSFIKEVCYLNEALLAMYRSLISFQRYVPKSLVKKLIHCGQVATVGGESRDLTILFSDIQGFTHLAETLPPEKLMQFLSEYFETMTDVVIQNKGTLDKYIGDAIMAFWNAPILDQQHVIHACQTALHMVKRLSQLNHNWKNRNLPVLSIRIGIHSGTAIVGNVGSEERLSYTSIGDAVNLASRLETLNKLYGTTILVSDVIYNMAKESFAFRFVDVVSVRGREQSTHLYELVSSENTDEFESYQVLFNAAFSKYQEGQWQDALSMFMVVSERYPNDKVALCFIDRCAHLIQEPPKQWEGIWKME